MLCLSILLTVSLLAAAAEATPPPSESSRPCRIPKPGHQSTSPPKPTIRFFRSPTNRKHGAPSRSSESTTTPVSTITFYSKPLNVAGQPYANSTAVNCQCQADFVQLVLLLTIVIGMPIAVCTCIYAIRYRFTDNRIHAKAPSLINGFEAADTIFRAEAAEATFSDVAKETNFAFETAYDAEVIEVPLATDVCSPTKRESEQETTSSDVTTVQPLTIAHTIVEPPSPCFSYRSPNKTTTSKSHYGRLPPRSSRWATNRGRPSDHFYGEQSAEPDRPMRNPFATLRAYPGSPPITSRRFENGRTQGPTRGHVQPRMPHRTRPRIQRRSRFSQNTQLALFPVVVLACAVTTCSAAEPAAGPATSDFAEVGTTVLVLLFLLMNTLGTAHDSPHVGTPPKDATDADEIPLYTPQTDWRIISGPPAEYDFSLDVPLPTPSPPPSPPPPPPPSTPPSISSVLEAARASPNFAAVISRYPTDTTVFVIYSVYVIVFETTSSAPSWIRAASRYAKTRMINTIRNTSGRQKAVIVINSDLPENAAVSIGRMLRRLSNVVEILLPNDLLFLLQANALAFTSIRAAFPSVARTASFAAESIMATTRRPTHEQAFHAALQAVFSAPTHEGYSDEDVATSLSRRAPSPEKHTLGNPSRLGT